MALCQYCGNEMTSSVSCVDDIFSYKGKSYAKIPYPTHMSNNCHDCNCPPGGFHHTGCDMERCPVCGGQLISCGCLWEEI